LLAFEAAEREPDPEKRRAWLRFIVVGAGPTGVELAGALAELARNTLKDDFRNIDPAETEVLLLEGLERVLPPYPPELSAKARASLEKLGVTVWTGATVTDIQPETVTIRRNEREEQVQARTVLWAAGMKASALGQILAGRVDAPLDKAGRVMVEPDLSIPGHPNIFVIGDLAHFAHQGGKPLPGVAPVAIQQGQYIADLIKRRLTGEKPRPFHYVNKGSLAVIGRNAGVADFGRVRFAGFIAWLTWVFVHLWYLVEFDNKLLVMFQWAWNYFTRNRGARLITGPEPLPLVLPEAEKEAAPERLPEFVEVG
jgi:NADH dehydrogenase